MPSASKKQHNFMAAVANNPKFAKKAGVSSAVGKEFLTADKGKTFKEGGTMKKMNPGMMAMMAKKKPMKMNDGGMPMVEKNGQKVPAFAADGKGKMAKGGMASDAKEDTKMDKTQDKAMIKKAFKQHDAQEHKGDKGTSLKLAKGGSFRSSANGIATKGKTKGTMIAMKSGGKAC
jgi:hypothetical protein